MFLVPLGSPTTRRGVLAGVAASLAGCLGDGDGGDDAGGGGGSGDGETNPAVGEVEDSGGLSLSSPAFVDGGSIPERFGRGHEDVNPPLSIEGVPGDAESLALVMDDPDAVQVQGEVWHHWLVWNLPPGTTEIPEAWPATDGEEGTNDFGEVGYVGPDPPEEPHRYRFKCFALGDSLQLPTETDAAAMGEAMQGRILARAQLEGSYAP